MLRYMDPITSAFTGDKLRLSRAFLKDIICLIDQAFMAGFNTMKLNPFSAQSSEIVR